MPRSREALLDAAFAHGQEDRLTEVFATVLDSCDELAAALFEAVGLPVGERFQVFTQVRVTSGERPDMLVHSLDRGGAEVSHIWSEHKVGSGFGDMQRERYLTAMRALPGQGELIFIVKDAPTSREEGDWRGFTWQEIGELAESVGRQWGGRDWREKAASRPRRRSGGCSTSCSGTWRTRRTSPWCMRSTATTCSPTSCWRRHCRPSRPAGARGAERRNAQADRRDGRGGPTLWQQFETPPGAWLHRLDGFDCAPEVLVSDRDRWSPEQLDEPAFAAGYSVDGKLHPVLSAKREWVRELDQAGFCCELWADHVCIYRTLPMSEVLTYGDTLSAQGERLGAWVEQAITELGRLDPGELALPGTRRHLAQGRIASSTRGLRWPAAGPYFQEFGDFSAACARLVRRGSRDRTVGLLTRRPQSVRCDWLTGTRRTACEWRTRAWRGLADEDLSVDDDRVGCRLRGYNAAIFDQFLDA